MLPYFSWCWGGNFEHKHRSQGESTATVAVTKPAAKVAATHRTERGGKDGGKKKGGENEGGRKVGERREGGFMGADQINVVIRTTPTYNFVPASEINLSPSDFNHSRL